MAKKVSRMGNPANYNAFPTARENGAYSALEVDQYGRLKLAKEYVLFTSITSSTIIISNVATLKGMYVNTVSGGTIRFYDGINSSGLPIGAAITPAVGYHNLGDIKVEDGIFALISGSINVTIHYTDEMIPVEDNGSAMN